MRDLIALSSLVQNYLEPLHQLQSKDLKEVAHHRKKLQVMTSCFQCLAAGFSSSSETRAVFPQGRKLDYDCKKRQQQSKGQVPDKEVKQVRVVMM